MRIINYVTLCVIYAYFAHAHDKDCQYPYREIAFGCYHISSHKVTANDAFALCSEKGGYLANFETLEESLLMTKHLKHTYKGTDFFVGGRNIDRYIKGGDWRWVKHGQLHKMAYKAFMRNMPNGSLSGPQDCMMFEDSFYYALNDADCEIHKGGYICEK